MTHAGLTHVYEVALGPAALRVVLRMRGECRDRVAETLRRELLNGPNADKEVRYDHEMRACPPGAKLNGAIYYTATPLSYGGYTAVHRPMNRDEIRQWRREHGHAASQGFYVFDILSATAAFTRSVPPRWA